MMKLTILPLLCLTGIISVALPIRLAPMLVMKNMTWENAQQYCRTMYIDQTVAKTANDLVMLTNKLTRHNVAGPVWLGLYNDFDNWRFSLNNLPLKNITLRNWGTNEPNNLNGHESCAGISETGLWWDTGCSDLLPIVCYDANNQRYVRSTMKMIWRDAQVYCRLHYTDLASSLSSTDINLIKEAISGVLFSWFGLFRDSWKWVDATNVDPRLWQFPLPDNAFPQENCGTLTSGKLDDKSCYNQYYFTCDIIPVVKYVVKIQVKAGDSAPDPAVLLAILQRIKEKLDANAVVSWRVQPDGTIFQKKIRNTSV